MNHLNSIRRSTFLMIFSCLIFSSCATEKYCDSGSGGIETITMDLEDISSLELQVYAIVNVKQGDVQSVSVKGHKNVLAALSKKVKKNSWKIKFEDGCYKKYDLVIDVTIPKVKSLVIAGSGNINVDDFTGLDKMNLVIAGSGEMSINSLDGLSSLNTNISGSGDIVFNETCSIKNVDITIAGSGDYDAFKVATEETDVTIAGSGDCSLNVSKDLDVTIAGSGDVVYTGDAKVSKTIIGSGDVTHK